MTLISSLYNNTWTVTRKTRTTDGQGGYTATWATSSTVEGRMRPASATERTEAMLLKYEVDNILYCATDEDIVRGDRITKDGRTWDVEAVRDPSYASFNDEPGNHLEIDLTERQKEGQP